jgi:isopenicillin N synthase-like dioxygenase
MNDIPLIDFSAWFHGSPKQRLDLANDIISAAHQPGFMYLQNFGVDPRETTKMFDMLEEYFALPLSIKQKNPYISAEANHGYNGFEEERLDPQGPGDLKETFTMRNVSQVSDNPTLWPSTNFRNMAQHFFHSCQLASNKILEALSLGLHMPQDYFVKYHTGENQTLRFLHYPQLPTHRPNQIGAGAHTDYGSITLLFQDDVGGLEVQDCDGHWIPAPYIPETAVVNIGDLMQRWTNNYLRSTLHRVSPTFRQGRHDRYSIAFFCDPDNDTLVQCLPSCMSHDIPAQYAPITARQHLLEKLRASRELIENDVSFDQ